jgi:hypothetical protein
MRSFCLDQDPAEVEARLTDAWVFLSGRARHFARFVAAPEPESIPGAKHLLMAATRATQVTLVGVGLVLRRQDAVEIAAAMFALPADELSDEDIDDASREACNIMSGCLTPTLSQGGEVDFERPREVPAAGYCAMLGSSQVLACYESRDCDGRVTVTAFDPLGGSRPAEAAP